MQRKFEEALDCAARWHAHQSRKGTRVPYVAHLLGVTSLVLEDEGTTTEAITALLHDAVEDQGGPRRLAEIRRRFGPRVAAIVQGCTDTDQSPKPPGAPARKPISDTSNTHPFRCWVSRSPTNCTMLVRSSPIISASGIVFGVGSVLLAGMCCGIIASSSLVSNDGFPASWRPS
jgi:hypothetical protein